MSAVVLAATDLVAGGGDVATLATGALGFALVLLVASGAALVVAGIEFAVERRVLRSLAKAAVAWMLVVLPTPVAGLVGAGASLGIRMLRPTPRG